MLLVNVNMYEITVLALCNKISVWLCVMLWFKFEHVCTGMCVLSHICQCVFDAYVCVCLNAVTHIMGVCFSSAPLAQSLFSIHFSNYPIRPTASQNFHV